MRRRRANLDKEHQLGQGASIATAIQSFDRSLNKVLVNTFMSTEPLGNRGQVSWKVLPLKLCLLNFNLVGCPRSKLSFQNRVAAIASLRAIRVAPSVASRTIVMSTGRSNSCEMYRLLVQPGLHSVVPMPLQVLEIVPGMYSK